MSITRRITIENVNLDDERETDAFMEQMFAEGLERVRAEGDELRRKGLLDEHGNMVIKELPADMKEGSERDFGGGRSDPRRVICAGPPRPRNAPPFSPSIFSRRRFHYGA